MIGRRKSHPETVPTEDQDCAACVDVTDQPVP
jgi:hypothetical protein